MSCKKVKDAVTLIVAARSPFQKVISSKDSAAERYEFDFKILTVKRSSKSTFMPNNFVFPGGHVEASDSSNEWLDLYSRYGVDVSRFAQLKNDLSNTDAARNIFHTHSTSKIDKHISLRISAIRETFEECGLMLCKKYSGDQSESADSWCSYLAGYETKKWQSEVQNDPSEFINACRYFECYPDIWALNTWSNWLTPTTFPKRFNAAFFLTTIHQIPPACADNAEVTEVRWLTPDEVLNLADAGDIAVPIPQLYEMARLQNFSSAENLHHFAVLRDTRPMQQWMSVHVACDDGTIFLLPGDDMYPMREDQESQAVVETLQGTVAELRARTMHLNRIENSNARWHVVSNLGSDLGAACIYPRSCSQAKL